MPYSPKAHRLFEAVAHDPALAKKKGISQAQARKMAGEGIKREDTMEEHADRHHPVKRR